MSLLSQIKSLDINKHKLSEETLSQMKDRFPGEALDTLARYLIAKRNDVKLATEQLERGNEKRSRVWPILKSSCLKEVNSGKCYIYGTDKDGRPVMIVNAYMHNPKESSPEEMVRMTLFFTEHALSRLPDNRSQFTMILDRNGYDSAADNEYMKQLSELYMDMYPERLHRSIVYPSGIVFYTMWNYIIKWFVEEDTREKVFPAMNLDEIRQFVDDKYIPQRMGGSSDFQFDADKILDPYPPELLSRYITDTATASDGSPGEATPAAVVVAAGDQNYGTITTTTDTTSTRSEARDLTGSQLLQSPLNIDITEYNDGDSDNTDDGSDCDNLYSSSKNSNGSSRISGVALAAAISDVYKVYDARRRIKDVDVYNTQGIHNIQNIQNIQNDSSEQHHHDNVWQEVESLADEEGDSDQLNNMAVMSSNSSGDGVASNGHFGETLATVNDKCGIAPDSANRLDDENDDNDDNVIGMKDLFVPAMAIAGALLLGMVTKLSRSLS